MPFPMTASQGEEHAAKGNTNTESFCDDSASHYEKQSSNSGAASNQTPPITPAIISSLSNEHILEIIKPLLADSSVLKDSTKEASIASLTQLLDSNKLTPDQFWESALLNIPWTLLQGDAYAVMRLRKVHATENKHKVPSWRKKMSSPKKPSPKNPAATQNPKKLKAIVLPPPANPPHYTKLEAAQILAQYKPASVIMQHMIDQNLVPCRKTQLYTIMKISKEGGDLNTPWTQEKPVPKEPEKVPYVPLDLLAPSNPPYYSQKEMVHLMSNLPAVTNPPYYTKAQTAALLLTCGPYEKVMIDKLVEQKLVPVVPNQLRNLLKKVKKGEADLTKSWNTKRAVDRDGEKKPGAKKRAAAVMEGEGQPKKKRRKENAVDGDSKAKKQKPEKALPASMLSRAFMAGAKSLDDADFVNHVALEFERRGYTFGLKLGLLKSDDDTAGNGEKKHSTENQTENGATAESSVGAMGTEAQNHEEKNSSNKSDADEGAVQTRTVGENDSSSGNKVSGISGDTAPTTTEAAAASLDDSTHKISAPAPALPLGILLYPSTAQPQVPSAKKWDEMYGQVRAFYKEHGHLKVTDKTLSKWLTRQRNQWEEMQKEGVHHLMTMQKVKKLNALRFGVLAFEAANPNSSDGLTVISEGRLKREAKREKLWNDRLNELKEFQQTHGTTVVPRHVNDRLSKWAYTQRVNIKLFREGDTTRFMTQEKIDKLAEIGFDISGESSKVRQDQRHRMKSKSDVKWEQNFNSLVEYKEKFGNCDVKNGENDEYKKLAGWVGVQRTKYKKKMNGQSPGRQFAITDEQIKKLAGIGFNFAGKRLDFDARFRQLLEFVKEHGHTRVPVFYAEHDNLGRWAKRMRDGIRTNEPWVNEIHKARLLGIGFDIEARQVFDHPWRKQPEPEQSGDDLTGLDFTQEE